MDEQLAGAVSETIASWPDVRAKQVFGHRGFVRGGKMFAFIADDGLGVKVVDAEARAELYARPDVAPFAYGGKMTMEQWPVLPLRTDVEAAEALSAAQLAYDAA